MCTHSLRQLLQFGFGKLQTLPFDMFVRRVRQQLVKGDDVPWNLKNKQESQRKLLFLNIGGRVCEYYLEHGISEERLQHPALTCGVGLVLFEQLVKVSVLLTVCQNLQTVLMVTHKLLVNVQHGQQDVKQIRWG